MVWCSLDIGDQIRRCTADDSLESTYLWGWVTFLLCAVSGQHFGLVHWAAPGSAGLGGTSAVVWVWSEC